MVLQTQGFSCLIRQPSFGLNSPLLPNSDPRRAVYFNFLMGYLEQGKSGNACCFDAHPCHHTCFVKTRQRRDSSGLQPRCYFGISFLLVWKREEKSFAVSQSFFFLLHFHPVLFVFNTVPNFDNWLILVAMLACILATCVNSTTLPLLLKGEKKREFLQQFLLNVQYNA